MSGLQEERLFDPATEPHPDPLQAAADRRWTTARRAGLLAFAGASGGWARMSNQTSLGKHFVYWQTMTWLNREGLVEWWPGEVGTPYRLTETGKAELAALGRVVKICRRLRAQYP